MRLSATAVTFAWLSLVGGIALVVPDTALAECLDAEKYRLSGELKKLAQRNAWSGVERTYEAMLATGCELDFEEHGLGAESARYLGKTYEMYERLTAAKAIDPQQAVLDSLAGLDGNYGRVEIKGDPRRRPILARAAMPFAPDQRKSIEWAITVVTETGSFKGMLPVGDYTISDIPFTVATGSEWQVVTVGKVKAPKPAPGDGGGGDGGGGDKPPAVAQNQSAINWAGLVATVGPNFMLTPAPGKPVEDDAGRHQFAPDNIFASGAQVQLGGELGLTYAAPEAGLAATIGYGGGFGNDTLHQFSGWLAGVVRPGEVRIAAGPTYSLITGKGTGVASWFDVGQDTGANPNENIKYQGVSWGGGAAASLGVGVFDVGESMRGYAELGGGWTTDGARNFMGFGLRVGLVPTVPRFKG